MIVGGVTAAAVATEEDIICQVDVGSVECEL